jgi:hypothetical protein
MQFYIILVVPLGAARDFDRGQQRVMPVRSGQKSRHDVRHIEDTGAKEDLFNALIVALHYQEPDQHSAHRHGNVPADVKQPEAACDAGKLCNDIREVHDHQQNHHKKCRAQSELFTDQVAEPFAGHNTEPRAHLLHDNQGQGHRQHRPEQRIPILRAGLRIGKDAAGIVIDVSRNESGPKDGEEDQYPDSPPSQHAHSQFILS